MGIFGRGSKKYPVAKETTVISANTKVIGELQLHSNLHIDGEIEGDIVCDVVVSIGKKGRVKGEIKAQRLLVSGILLGKAECETIEIFGSGKIEGDIVVEHLSVEKGGIFDGICHYKKAKPIDIDEDIKNLVLKEEERRSSTLQK